MLLHSQIIDFGNFSNGLRVFFLYAFLCVHGHKTFLIPLFFFLPGHKHENGCNDQPV